MGLQNHALFQVATKTLLFDGDKVLALMTSDGYIDFPGGRVDATEVKLDWHEALRREVAEELGPAVRISIGKTLFVAKRSYHHDGQTHRIAAIYFASELLGGGIQLSDEHGSYQWMTPQELLAPDHQFVSDDEKHQLQAYFAARD